VRALNMSSLDETKIREKLDSILELVDSCLEICSKFSFAPQRQGEKDGGDVEET
jgi:hypothetical protein